MQVAEKTAKGNIYHLGDKGSSRDPQAILSGIGVVRMRRPNIEIEGKRGEGCKVPLKNRSSIRRKLFKLDPGNSCFKLDPGISATIDLDFADPSQLTSEYQMDLQACRPRRGPNLLCSEALYSFSIKLLRVQG